jgi:hypothetical protein
MKASTDAEERVIRRCMEEDGQQGEQHGGIIGATLN